MSGYDRPIFLIGDVLTSGWVNVFLRKGTYVVGGMKKKQRPPFVKEKPLYRIRVKVKEVPASFLVSKDMERTIRKMRRKRRIR